MYFDFYCKLCESSLVIKIENVDQDEGTCKVIRCPNCAAEYAVGISGNSIENLTWVKLPESYECNNCKYLNYLGHLDDLEDDLDDEVCLAYCRLEEHVFKEYTRTYCDKSEATDISNNSLGIILDLIEEETYEFKVLCRSLEQVETILKLLTKIYKENKIEYVFADSVNRGAASLEDVYQFRLAIRKSCNRVIFCREYNISEKDENTIYYYNLYHALVDPEYNTWIINL